jgi:hypothetical protein
MTVRRIVAVAIVVIVGVTWASNAYASHTSATMPFQLTVNESGLDGIAPGGTGATIYTIVNPNADAVTLGDRSPYPSVLSAFAVDVAHSGCDPAWFSFIPQGGESGTYGPRRSVTYTGSVHMQEAGVNQDGCMGAIVAITLSVPDSV